MQGTQSALIGIPSGKFQNRIHQLGHRPDAKVSKGVAVRRQASPWCLLESSSRRCSKWWFTQLTVIFRWAISTVGPWGRLHCLDAVNASHQTSATKTSTVKSWPRGLRKPPTSPTIFANVSNLGWFNNTVALQQHLTISRVRALEFQRPFVRATNTGATAFLSHEGKVIDMLPPLTRGVLHGGRCKAAPV